MKSDFNKVNSFSCPIYKIRIDPNSYDKEKIINDILYNKSLKNTRNEPHQDFHSDCNIHHSYGDFDNENFRIINYEKILVIYQELFQKFFDKEITTRKQFNWEFNIVNYTAMTEGQWFPVHHHPTDDFAAIHYLNYKDDHSPTLFHNPQNFSPYLKYLRPELVNILNRESPDNQYIQEHVAWKVEEDDILIFPSVLNHEMKPQGPTKESRITIATNLRILSQEK